MIFCFRGPFGYLLPACTHTSLPSCQASPSTGHSPKDWPTNFSSCRAGRKPVCCSEVGLLVECGKRAQAQNLLRTNRFIDRQVRVSIHKTLNSFRGVIRCRDLADISEVEIRDELKDQGVVGVNPSDTEEGGEGDPHQHSFLDVRFPGTPKRDHGRLSKGEGGLVCSQPYALLQRKSVFVRAKETQLSAILWSRGSILL